MLYELKNEHLKAVINSKGAELVQLIDADGINRMHSPNKETWDKTSPILFPQISKFKDFLYRVNGKEYHMPRHGFFRDMDLIPTEKNDTSLVFYIEDDEKTYEVYPFHFGFYVKFELINNSLKVNFKVINKDNKKMYYMLGGHPGFKAPLYENESYEDYYVLFEKNETIDAMQVVDGYLANVYKPCLNNENTINLKHDMFDPDAIILRGLKSKYVELKSDKNDKKIRFHCSDFEILAIWSKTLKNADFVCFEPWNGIQKDFVVDYEKMGVLSLNRNEKKEFSYIIEVIN